MAYVGSVRQIRSCPYPALLAMDRGAKVPVSPMPIETIELAGAVVIWRKVVMVFPVGAGYGESIKRDMALRWRFLSEAVAPPILRRGTMG